MNKSLSCCMSQEVSHKAKEKQGGHKCLFVALEDPYKEVVGWGTAVDCCVELEDGTFMVTNDEYSNRVNYCPFCGAKAPTQVVLEASEY